MKTKELNSIFKDCNFMCGRMIGYSKSEYRQEHPGHEVYFNANIIDGDGNKIWWGDIDITLDKDKLNTLSSLLGQQIYVLRELDCRFENENQSAEQLKRLAVWPVEK